MSVHELVLVCVWVCVIFACVYLCAWQKHDMIRAALGTSHLKLEILVPYMYPVEHGHNYDLTN